MNHASLFTIPELFIAVGAGVLFSLFSATFALWQTRRAKRRRITIRTRDGARVETNTLSWDEIHSNLEGLVRKIQGSASVFLSYASEDQATAERLRDVLESQGVSVWLASDRLKAGDEIPKTLGEASEESKRFLYVIPQSHASSGSSRWVERELEMALDEEIKRGTKFIIPIRISDDREPPDALKDRLWVDLPPYPTPDAEGIRILVEAITR